MSWDASRDPAPPDTIVITPGPLELGLYGDAYNDVVGALQAAGIKARLDEPIERRGGIDLRIVADVLVYVGEHVRDQAIGSLVTILFQKLSKLRRPRAQKGTPRIVLIYGPRGEVLRRVEVPSDED